MSHWENPLVMPWDSRLERVAGPAGLVLFGLTGDLSKRKILPAIYDLAHRGLLPPSFTLIGVARPKKGIDDFTKMAEEAIRAGANTGIDERVLAQLMSGFRQVIGDYTSEETFAKLSEELARAETERGTGGNYAFYLAIPPKLFPHVLKELKAAGLDRHEDSGWRRVMIEKPFGHDLASSKELNDVVLDVFEPSEIFRIDHYLGKETVQNILALRFANELYEPLWNNAHIDHVEITMAEDIGVAGRGGYYDGVGAARDVIQNHLLQLLALTAMEEPTAFTPQALRMEKEKVLSATHFIGSVEESSVFAQYDAGWQGGDYVTSFRGEEGIADDSRTDTFAAFRLGINNRRWAGVPFYLRAGKRLGRRVTEIALTFRTPPFQFFSNEAMANVNANTLVIRIQPEEGVTFKFGSKVPGTQTMLRDVTMDFGYGHAFTEYTPEAYERLILDVLMGEEPLFPQQTELELSWALVDQATNYWEHTDREIPQYAPGSWGPQEAHDMLALDGRVWRRP
ncbi:glucose-6-phosphate 1-dehydrogenase [Arcanobacterium wilhelmae]|uniref:Glucose-6-phosphate 1-dehydrogenase n=1 Tax=Arcanobacterium wilhelmae TaxID=1803177 RepID=A0ABT9N9B4_9ACTO|nr:glucose-6-phosphate dehydrogenase [Arcanobacterium wilhelmae]MDP9799996.1 glucose-6-phosphate 1-dehydrogenase [Arcanobacterium wilhelmae]WFN89495.1 glucose-6-phosphate dehydrogenase [Arcanobacterium wilhelmae]